MRSRMFSVKKICCILQLLIMSSVLYAQENKVTGRITDATTGAPLSGIKVEYKNLFAAITDTAGKFSLKVPDYDATIQIQGEGFQTKLIPLRGQKQLGIRLFEDAYTSQFDQVTLPLQTVNASQATNAGTTIKTEGGKRMVFETADSYLQGNVAGLNAVRRSGTPGIGANLLLRGFNSLYATNQPLIVVDGVIYDINASQQSIISNHYNNALSFIDIKDIDNISVIKDGSTIYGTKGANGVILISTARTSQQGTRIDASLFGGANMAPANMPVLGVSGYRTYLQEMLQSKGMSYDEIQALPYMNTDPANPNYARYHYNTDWQRRVLNSSSLKNGYLKITGGDNIARYGLTLGFSNSGGIISATDQKRYSMRFNGDFDLSKRLTASTNIGFSYNEQTLKDQGISIRTNPIYASLVKAPFLAVQDVADNGAESPSLAGYDVFNISNPVALIRNMQANTKNYRFAGSIRFKYQISDKWSLGNTVAVTVDKIRETFFVPRLGVVPDTMDNAIVYNHSGSSPSRLFNLYNDLRATYHNDLGKDNELTINAGVRYMQTNEEQDKGEGFNSATDKLTSVSFGVNSLRRIGGSIGDSRWISTYVSADYNYARRYFLTLNAAFDGSSKFGKQVNGAADVIKLGSNSYAFMPSLSAAWLISGERFMAKHTWIDLLKWRASAGLSGNDDIGNYTARKYYVSQNLLDIYGLVRGNAGNPALRWERVTRLNTGFDLAVLNERLNVSADVYSHKTTNMIVYEPLPSVAGLEYGISNSGAMKTTGWELTVSGRIINSKKVKWDAGFNIAHASTKVTALPVDRILTGYAGGTILTQVGNAPNVFYGYKTNGVYTSDAEAAAGGLSNLNPDGSTTAFKGGDMRFVNVNTSGGNKIIDGDDRQIIGNPNPDFFGGINSKVQWKRFTLDLLFTYSKGNDVYNYARRELESMTGYNNQLQSVGNRWRSNGQVTDMPKAVWGDPMGNSRFSDRWIEDGSYLRLRTASVAYELPVKPGFIRYARVYLAGNNLFTITKYKGYDPEFSATTSPFGQGVDLMLEPQPRSVQAGVIVGL